MADSYYGGGAGAGGGGNLEWELVSLTASTYAAAPGPVPVPVLPLHDADAHSKTEQLTPPPAAIFMSQHFNLPAATGSCADLNLNGDRQQQLSLAMPMLDDEAVDPESETEQEDDGLTLTSSDAHKSSNAADDVLIADADIALLPSPSEERQTTPPGFDTVQPDAAASSDHHHIRSTSPPHHNVPAADTDSDGITTVVVGSASQPAAARAVPSGPGVAENKVPSEAHAWWNKTVRFLRNNSKESLTFRFIFVAATGLAVLGQRDQLKLEFNVDTEKISCAVREPLGQVKLNMLVGGRPVAQG